MGHKGRRNNNNRCKNNSNQIQSQSTQNNYPKASQQQLQVQCFQLYQLLCNKTKILKQQTIDHCFIISTKWLEDWKQYVGFYNLDEDDHKKHKKLGKKHPGKINCQIVQDAKNFYHVPIQRYQFLNTVVSEKKEKDDDYIALAKQIWQAFAARYDHVQIKRPKRVSKKGTILYDGSMLQLQVVIVNFSDNQLIQKIQSTKQMPKGDLDDDFSCDKMQLSTLWTFEQLRQFLTDYCTAMFNQQQFKIWKIQGYATVGQVQRAIWQGINKKTSKIPVPCRQLTKQKYEELDLDEFLKDYYSLVLQIGKPRIQRAEVPQDLQGYCEQCIKKKKLNVTCVCEQIFYCSHQCRIVDQVWHQTVCKQAFDSQDDQVYQKKTVNIGQQLSPTCGLDNLGNTCYMNSVLQALISVDQFANFFASNQFLKQIDPKEKEQNNGRLVRKYSKFFKQLAEKKQSLTPWSLKGEVNYFLPPFKGFKQHDANDFLLNFINALNQQLKKQEGKAYHRLFEDNFMGQFSSLIKCPECTIQISNDEIFSQITLPIKHRAKTQTTNYVIYQNSRNIIKGKCEVQNTWQEMRKTLGLKNSCLLMAARQGQHVINVEEDQSVEKTIKKIKRQIVYYPNCEYDQFDDLFSFLPITQKNMYGQRMKAPYGYPAIINVNPQLHTLGTFWVQILKQFTEPQTYQQAIQIKQAYFRQIQQAVITIHTKEQDKKSPQESPMSLTEQWQQAKQTAQNQSRQKQRKQVQDLTKAIQQKSSNALKSLLHQQKLRVFINDTKKNRNLCAFCKKKCTGCELPVSFSLDLKEYLQGKTNEVNFQIVLEEKVLQEKTQRDTAKSGEPTLHDCMQLFTEPEQLDQENAWWCHTCQNLRLAYKQLTIKKLPRVLIIHLNRFKAQGQKRVKNPQPIQYQEYEQFCGKTYQLLSVIVHQGSTEGGHYWSICKRNNKYYIFNDSKVSPTQKICNKNAYIVIYQRIQQKL